MRRFSCFSRNHSPPPPSPNSTEPPLAKPRESFGRGREQSISSVTVSSSSSSSCSSSSTLGLGPGGPYDEEQINRAIHVFLVAQTNVNSIPHTAPALEILSIHSRGVTVAGWNANLQKRVVLRVSSRGQRLTGSITARDVSGPNQSAERIWLFGRFMTKQYGADIRGVIPFLSPPKLVKKRFLIEQYEEVSFRQTSVVGEKDDDGQDKKSHRHETECRLDLHTFIAGQMDDARQGFVYLHDVLTGMMEMHRHGWAHLDLSLENVVLSNDHAYIIDFESVLPFATEENGCLRRRDLRVPLKAPFVPPEHFEAAGDDLVSLATYDVWAFGIMFFTVLFREYLIASREVRDDRIGRKQLVPDSNQVNYFLEHGFKKFMEKYHPKKYTLLFDVDRARSNSDGSRKKFDDRTSSYLQSCGDLLSHIFVRPCIAREIRNSDGSQQLEHHGPNARHVLENSDTTICFCDCARYTAKDIYDHPFWELHNIRTNDG